MASAFELAIAARKKRKKEAVSVTAPAAPAVPETIVSDSTADITQSAFQQAITARRERVPKPVLEPAVQQPQEPSFLARSAQFLERGPFSLVEGVIEAFTGSEKETEETQTLPESGAIQIKGFGNALKTAVGRLSAFSEEGQMNVLREAVPNISFRKDEKGNVIAQVPDQGEFILNKPGASPADIRELTAKMLSFLPVTRLAGLVSSITAKGAVGAAGSAAVEAGIQTTGILAGTQEEISPERIGLAAVAGGVSEAAVPLIGARINRAKARKFDVDVADLGDIEPAVREAQAAQRGLEAELALPDLL